MSVLDTHPVLLLTGRMALTATQVAQLRQYLGYPARFHNTHPEFDQAILALASQPDDETQVIALLALLAAPTTGIDARLTDALDRLQASAVGSIELNPAEIGNLRAEGRRIVRRIAATLGITPAADCYGGGVIDNRW